MKKCGKCKITKKYSEFCKDRSKPSGLANKCRACKKFYYNKDKQSFIDRYNNNKEHYQQYQLEYYYNNSKERIKYQIEYTKERIKYDPLFKLSITLRSRINIIFKNKKYIKPTTMKIIGCDLKFAKHHLESQFSEGMCWENHGLYGWHIDHIIPLSSATSEEDLIKLCHYTNLQPLWAKDNLSKSDKII